MNTLEVIIVEDEFHSQQALKNLLEEFCPAVLLKGIASTVDEGLKLLATTRPDLVFLDIELSKESGFDLLKRAKKLDFEVIFTTAYKEYALNAIKFSAVDYLLKPIDVEELQQAVEKVLAKKREAIYNRKLEMLLANMTTANIEQHKITLSTVEGHEFIDVAKINYCEANGAYTIFHIKERKPLMVSKHLKEYEKLLLDYGFMRVHQSYLVNLNEVLQYKKSDGGAIIMKSGDMVSISAKKKEAFMQKMANLSS